jgi:hypothetical protein
MIVRNTLCKRIIVGYCIFFLTIILIWKHHENSIKLEEDEDTLKPIIPSYLTRTTTTTIFKEIETKIIDQNRLDYWLKNNSKTIGINLTAILAPKRPGKYLVYVCHENCGGNFLKIHFNLNIFSLKVGEIVFVV